MRKLAIITTHPIQYNAPLFEKLASNKKLEIKVFYTWGKDSIKKYDPGFKQIIEWDIPLLNGYNFQFEVNASKNPGSSSFWGIINPHLIQNLKKFNPDALIIYGWNFYSHIKLLLHFSSKIKIIFRGDSHLLDETDYAPLKKICRNLFLKWLYKHVDFFLYVGENNKLYYKKSGIKDSQLRYCPHAVNNEFYNESIQNIAELNKWRKALDMHTNNIVFLFAGKFENKKNPLLLIKAFKKVNNVNAKLLMVGNGELEEQLKNESASDNRICFLDFQNQRNMPYIYGISDVYVLPSKGPNETWGLAVNEAMACGKPVIVSNRVGCYLDLVQNKNTGFVFESDNEEDLINKLVKCLNKDLLENLGKNAHKLIQEFGFSQQAKVIEELV